MEEDIVDGQCNYYNNNMHIIGEDFAKDFRSSPSDLVAAEEGTDKLKESSSSTVELGPEIDSPSKDIQSQEETVLPITSSTIIISDEDGNQIQHQQSEDDEAKSAIPESKIDSDPKSEKGGKEDLEKVETSAPTTNALVIVTTSSTITSTTMVKNRSPIMSGPAVPPYPHTSLQHFHPPPPHHLHPNHPGFLPHFLHPPPNGLNNNQHPSHHQQFLHANQFQQQPHYPHLLSTSSLQPAGPLPTFPPPFPPPPFGTFYGPPPTLPPTSIAGGGIEQQPKYDQPPPWAQFGSGLGLNLPPPPMGMNLSQSIPSTPLPAFFPLPLDPTQPPAVLPSFSHPHGTNQSSGYSTAGHSRSSSPMGGHRASPVEMCSSGNLSANSSGVNPSSCPNSLPCQNPSPNLVFAAASAELTLFSHFPTLPGQYVVYFHINPGVSVSFHVGEQLQVVKGPMTVPLVSTNSNPPIPLPMQVPPGHVVQQIVDESGTLRHVIVSHQPPLMPIPAFGPGSQNQPFYSPGPGFPGAPFGPMQGVPYSNHGSTTPSNLMGGNSYMSHAPPHAHKDDRHQRQYVKLRKKLEQKQQEPRSYQGHYNQNGNYQGGFNNNNNNNVRRNIPNGTPKSNGGGLEEDGSVGSTGSVTSTGTQDEEEETRVITQTEMLSSLIPPIITDITCRSACIKWSQPERFTEAGENKYPEFDYADTEFRYEVLISDKSRGDTRLRSIFLGTALTCKLKDLKPATLYAVTYCCMLNDFKGNNSATSNFSTLPAEPDAPPSPRNVTRTRSAIQMKWNPPLNDNGSKITNYVLEYDEGKGDEHHFVEIYRGKNKQCTVSKLQPAFSYQFRLCALNQYGQSRWSSVSTVMTSGSPPSQPLPATLTEAGVTYLILEWIGRPTDDQYTLQMEDPTTGHGFICVYNGDAPHYTCVGLQRNSPYKFRVKAQNEEGHSKWSEDVVLRTLPNRPGPPHKPMLKGRIHSSNFKVRWEAQDDGGTPVTGFALQIDQGNGRFDEIYRGTDTEYNVDKLSPGQSYPLRVVAINTAGESDPSEPCVITTEPVCPGKLSIPRIMGKPKSNSLNLKWNAPDWDGGSPVNLFEVDCTTPDNQTQEAYRGKETCCSVNRLLPGRAYLFQIRAYNRIGAGPWSDPLEVVTGAGQPDTPSAPKVLSKACNVILSWSEPLNNGSAVTEYRVQMATPYIPSLYEESQPEIDESESKNTSDDPKDLTDITDHTDGPSSPSSTEIVESELPPVQPVTSFTQVFCGPHLSCEVKGLQPASVYLFRVQASNIAGSSDWSPVISHQTSASSPSAVSNVEGVASTSSISLVWLAAAANGSPILHYNLMLGDTLIIASSNDYTFDNLMPDTHYRIRIQAVNSVGPGPFSSALKISTKPLPPLPPKLELVSVAHFWMKLKWNETTPKNIEYIVQMINPYHDEFQVVYRGAGINCKVTRLTEDTEYQFRICALNTAGQGAFSDMYRFSTIKAPPSQVKGFKVTLVKELETLRFEWADVNSSHTVTYQLQVAKRRDQEFKTVYRGEVKKFELKHEELDAGIDYTSRVCAIRPCGDGNYLIGPYSNPANFHISLPPLEDASSKLQSSSSFTSNLSTTAQKLEDKVNSISYESRVGIIAVISLIILAFFISFITHHVVT